MSKILGYYKDGRPLYDIKPGLVATAAVVACCECRTIIRSMGGPQYGAKCVPCYEKEVPNGTHNPASDA